MFKKFRSRTTRSAGAALALAAAFVVAMVGPAFADSPNPIPSTVHADMTENPGGSVTVRVYGQWDWVTHKHDCNDDRNGAGIAIVWNDPHDQGYPVSNGGGIEVGSTANTDNVVHPSDADQAGQSVNDVSDPSQYASWRSGCGTFNGSYPAGTFGMDTQSGYTHTYQSKNDVSKVCVVTYDVHGGGKVGDNKFQEVKGSKEIAIDGNGDNAIKTNKFDVNSDCFTPQIVVPVGTIGIIGFAVLIAGVLFFMQRRSRRQTVES